MMQRFLASIIGAVLLLTVVVQPAQADDLTVWLHSSARAFSPDGDGQEDGFDVAFSLSSPSNVDIEVFDGDEMIRSLVKGQSFPPYSHSYTTWDGHADGGAVAADGDYTIHITAVDATGSVKTVTQAVTVDTRVPAAVISPAPGSTLSGLVELAVQPTMGLDVRSVSWQLAGCYWTQNEVDEAGLFRLGQVDTADCTAGDQTLQVYANWVDGYSQWHSLPLPQIPVTVADVTAPVVVPYQTAKQTVALQAPGQFATVFLAFTCRDASETTWQVRVTDAASETVRALDGTGGRCGSYYYDWYAYWDGTDDAGDLVPAGDYTVVATVTDAQGLTGSYDYPVTVDDRTPFTSETPHPGDELSGAVILRIAPTAGIELTYAAWSLPGCWFSSSTPELDGSLQVTADTSACSPGEHRLTVYGEWRDPAGSYHSYSENLDVTVRDSVPPVLSRYNSGPAVIVLTQPGTSSGLWQGVRCVDSATVTWSAELRDAAGAPVWTMPEANTSCNGYWYDLSFSLDGTDGAGALLADGDYSMHIEAEDEGGLGGTLEYPVLVDHREPATLESPEPEAELATTTDLILRPASGTTVTSVYWWLGGCYWSVDQPAVDGSFRVDGADVSSCMAGEQQLGTSVEWTDVLGVRHSYSLSTPVTVADATAPIVTWAGGETLVTLGSPGQTSGIWLALRCVDSSAVTWAVEIQALSGQVVYSYPVTPSGHCSNSYYQSWGDTWDGRDDGGNLLPDGEYILVAEATDAGGLTTTFERPVRLDTRVPGQLVSPRAGDTLAGRAQFAFQPSEGFTGIDHVLLWLPNWSTTLYNPSPDGVWRTAYPVGGLAQGPATLSYYVYWLDTSGGGHYYSADPFEVGIDPTSLVLRAEAAPLRGVAPFSTELTVTASDPHDKRLTVRVNWGDGSPVESRELASPYPELTLSHEFATAGSYNVLVSASNGEGGYASQSIAVVADGRPNQAPNLSVAVTPISGAAPLEVTALLDASDPDAGDTLTYQVDFGDGTAAVSGSYPVAAISHSYALPGSYLVRSTVSDGRLSAARSTRVTVVLPEPVTAHAGDDQLVQVGQVVTLDGSASRPSALLTGYSWTFGDGATGSGARVTHAYSSPGAYTAELTAAVGSNTAKDTATITVIPVPPEPGLTVTVTSGGQPVAGAEVSVVQGDGSRLTAVSDADGKAVVKGLGNGAVTAYVWADGYQPAVVSATIADGSGSAQASLTSGQVGASLIEYHQLTIEEIEDRGIDTSAPENQHVFQADINLYFEPPPSEGGEPEPEPMPVTVLWNGIGAIVSIEIPDLGEESGGSGCDPTDAEGQCFILSGYSFYPTIQYVEEQPVIQWLVIPVQASFLKQFFDVTLIVQNLTEGFTFTEGVAGIDLPAGLSLAPTGTPQTASVEVPEIAGGTSRRITWTVRGDVEGHYDLSAAYSGLVEPVDKPITLRAQTASPLHIWGGSALTMKVVADKHAVRWGPYAVEVELRNVSDIPIYNATLELKDRPADAPQWAAEYFFAPLTEYVQKQAVIEPGQTFRGRWVLYPGLGNDDVTTLDLVKEMSFVSQTGGDVTLATEIEERENDSSVIQQQEIRKDVKKLPGVDETVVTWDATRPVDGRTIVGYRFFARQELRSGGTWQEYQSGRVYTERSLSIPATAHALGRYYALLTVFDDGSTMVAHKVGTGAARYVALGDSYSSGEGAPEYEPDTATDGNSCHRSKGSYSRLLSARTDLSVNLHPTTYAACSGAVTRDLELPNPDNKGKADANAEVAQLKHVNEFTDVITMSMGGNDIGFADVGKACVLEDCRGLLSTAGALLWKTRTVAKWAVSCSAPDPTFVTKLSCVYYTYSLLNGVETDPQRVSSPLYLQPPLLGGRSVLQQRLERVYGKLAEDAPRARILIVGYPHLVTEGDRSKSCQVTPWSNTDLDLLALTGSEREFIRDLVDKLNTAISDSVKRADQDARTKGLVASFVFVDPNANAAPFAGKELCKGGDLKAPLAFNPLPDLLLSSDPGSDYKAAFHPNPAGHEAYAEVVAPYLGAHAASGTATLATGSGAVTTTTIGTLAVDENYRRLVAITSGSGGVTQLVSPSGQVHPAASARGRSTLQTVTAGQSGEESWIEIADAEAGQWEVRVVLAEGEPSATVFVTAMALTVAPVHPVALASVTKAADGSFVFDASQSYTDEGTIAGYEWRLPDDRTRTGSTVVVSFSGTEVPALALKVTSSTGATDTLAVSVPDDLMSVPSEPRQLVVTAVGDGFTASWEPPVDNGGGYLTGYTLRYRTGSDEWAGIETVETSYSVTGLEPGARYQVEVVASSAAGSGPPAQAEVTLDAEPVRPIVTGSVEAAPNDAGWYAAPVTVTWTAQDGEGNPLPAPAATIVGEGQWYATSAEVCDAAGCATGSFGPLNIDLTPPTIAAETVETEQGPVVHFTCSDTLSGVADCPDDVLAAAVPGPVSGTARDLAGNEATASLEAVLELGAVVPHITGTAISGVTLQAVTGSWGVAGVSFAYQWLRAGNAIKGAEASSYALTPDDIGHQIAVRVTGSKQGYPIVEMESAPTAKVAGASFTAPMPVISGTPKYGQTLTATAGTWQPAPSSLQVQWLRDGKPIAGANASSYRLVAADVDARISVSVTAKLAGYSTTTVASAQTSVVVGLKFTKAPTPKISGKAVFGAKLTAKPGTWKPKPSFSYQWYRGEVPIAGATKSTYVLRADDMGKRISVMVTARKSTYSSVAKRTKATATVAALKLSKTPKPTISGVAKTGAKLTAKAGKWKPSGVALAYQWHRDGRPIPNAIGSTYLLIAADAGRRITVSVIGSKTGYKTVRTTSKAVLVKT